MPLRARLTLLSLGVSLAVVVGNARCATLFSLYPIMQVTESYDDNITLAATHHLSDFITTGVTGFALDFGGDGRTGSFQYDTVFQNYATHTEFNSYAGTNFVTLVDAEALSPDLSMYVNDSVVVGNITGGLLVGNTGAVSSQVAQAALTSGQTESNNFNVQFNRRIGERWTATLGVSQNYYSGALETEYSQAGTTSLLYAVLPQLQTGLGYTFTDFRFSDEPPSEAHTVQLVAHWSPTERLKVDLAGGFVAVDNFGGPRGSFLVRPAGNGALTFLGERWTVTLGGGQVANIAGGLGGAGLNRFVNGVISYALQRHTFANFGASYSDYVGGSANGSFASFGAGLSTQPRKWLTLFAQYQGFSNSIGAATSAPIGVFTVPAGKTAATNTYTVGIKIAFDAYDYAL
jgi:hypothetical protein